MNNKLNKKWYTSWWAITIYVVAGLAILFLLIPSPAADNSYQELITKLKQGNKNLTPEENKALMDDNNPQLGNDEADITIVEFFSFDCPGARSMHSTVREIGINYADDVRIIHRDYPVSEDAIQYSLAARCAGEQGQFWSMYDRLFQQENLQLSDIVPLAQRTNLDMEKFQECFESGKYLEEIKKDMQEGNKLNVQGSPTTFINGYKIERPIPRDIFMSIIETIADAKTEIGN